jgi:uncharacterized lipoprotein YmbA
MMKRSLSGSCIAAILLAILLVLTGCGSSPPVRYYSLTPQPAETGTRQSAGVADVVFGPVALAAYLDRPEIVTRVADEELRFSEVHRWSGRLREDIVISGTNTLRELLPGATFVADSNPGASAARYRADVVVSRLDGHPSGELVLDASWAVIKQPENEILISGRTVARQSVQGEGYDALVRAHAAAVQQLGADIASALSPLLNQ